MLRPEHTHENSLWVHEFIKFISLQVNEFVSLSQIGRRKNVFILPKEKKNTRKSNQELINSKEYQLKSPPTQNLKLPPFLLQNHSNFRSVLAKILVKKQVKSRFFYPFTPFVLSVLKNKTCILHHIAFLVCLPTRIFQLQITHI